MDFKLRDFGESDAYAVSQKIDDDTMRTDTTIDLPWNFEKAKWWVSYIIDAASNYPLQERHFVIDVAGELAGSIGILNIDQHKAEIGYWLAKDFRGKGIMAKVIEQTVNYAFEEMDLKRIFAPILCHNEGSAKVLTKNGFTKEGTLKGFYIKDGRLIDAYSYSKIKV